MYVYIRTNYFPCLVPPSKTPRGLATLGEGHRGIVSFSAGILDTIEKVVSRFAKVTCFIVPLAIIVRRIPNTIGKVPPLGAKVTCFLGPLAALPGSGRPGVAGGRLGLFRGPAEAPFP